MPSLSGIQLQALRAQLEERARTLVAELKMVEEERPGVPTRTQTTVEDSGEQGEQRTRDAVRGAEQERDAAELREISAAIARIDDGTYGTCVDCGNDIPLARLQVQPAAARCIECQERYERKFPPELRAAALR